MRFFLKINKWNYLTVSARIANDKIEGGRQNISFFVDTGAPHCSIGFSDALRLGLNFDSLEEDEGKHLIGGTKFDRWIMADSTITIIDDTNSSRNFNLHSIFVLSPDPPGEKPLPSILGNNFISQLTLVINAIRFGRRAFFVDERVQ